MAITSKTTEIHNLSPGQLAFLRGVEIEGYSSRPGIPYREVMLFHCLANGDDNAFARGPSAAQLVRRHGREFLAEYEAAHPGEKPAWYAEHGHELRD
jgi:hypothetical protein